jgi:hypothetical protein
MNNGDGPSDISGPLLLRACGTCAVPTSPNSSDGPSDISRSLLLPSTVVMGDMTSDECCYCWARGIHVIATSPYSSVDCSDISAHQH